MTSHADFLKSKGFVLMPYSWLTQPGRTLQGNKVITSAGYHNHFGGVYTERPEDYSGGIFVDPIFIAFDSEN